MKTIGEHMKDARRDAGFSIDKLSEVSGVNARTIQNYESNRSNPSAFNLIALADVLGMSIDEYIGHQVGAAEKTDHG